MPDKKITALTALAGPGIDTANDLLAIVDADAGPAETKSVTVAALGSVIADVFGPAGPVVDAEIVVFDLTTGKLIKSSGTTIAALTASHVVGPASATDNAIVRYDLATGKLVQDSGVLINNTNEMSIPGNVANGQFLNVKAKTALLSMTTGVATKDEANFFIAGTLVLGFTALVKTVIVGCTTFNIGDDVDPDAYGAGIAVAGTTTTDYTEFTIASPMIYTSNRPCRLTALGGGVVFTTGEVRITQYYLDLTPATT